MSIGERLKDERERLGLSQPAFAAVAGAAKRTLIDWEKGATSPNAVQLAALSAIGVDVLYILTGQRTMDALSRDEQELLERFRAASLEGRLAALGALRGVTMPAPKIQVETNHGQVVEGGLLQTGPVTFGGKSGR
ncbi:MAG: helix-turn-helix domain-containing protein [Pseudomonadota bacterium]